VIALAGLFAGGAVVATAVAQSPAPLPQDNETRAVIELFTSQGCSSCPPADKVLGEYADRKDVLALSFNVDYWDYLGWKDTLANPDNTARQKGYAQARGDGQVYTPQAVIDGRAHAVGSSKAAIEAALEEYSDGLPVPLALSSNADAITVRIGEPGPSLAADLPHATLWLVMYARTVSVPIARGENTGKTVTYNNVVRKMRPIAMWKGGAMSVDLPKSEMKLAAVKRLAVLLQTETAEGLPGPIIGAATMQGGW
jgi:hypothetical protein